MLKRISGSAALAALVVSLVAVSSTSALAQGGNNTNNNPLAVPITGVVQNVGTIAGTFNISRFVIQNGALMAIGQLTATITDAAGNVRTIVRNIAWPVADAGSLEGAGSCDILNLVLGPLDLNLLGLHVELNQVVLTITGETGAGNLLGNLLCAITGLLDAGVLGQQVVNLLNQLIGLLGAV